MRTLAQIITITLAAIFISTQLSASELEVRFEKGTYNADTKEVAVLVQVRNAGAQDINLAGQNYRFFYDSEVLSLDTENSISLLTRKSYTDITFDKDIKGIQADKVNQVTFDDNLGFANFYIDLHNLRDGGIVIDEEWTTIASLSFDVKKESKGYDLVWGRVGATDKYATAFVAITEWVSPKKLDGVEIAYYGDLSSQEDPENLVDFSAAIGPNPTSDYINIKLDQTLESDAHVIIRSMTGQLVTSAIITTGEVATTVDLSAVTAATYVVEINDGHSIINKSRVVVAK